jgi:iron complex transport system ATP-binding protein
MPLTASHLSYSYRERAAARAEPAVRNVTLSIARGALTGLLGPNGCGKTTLLKLLAGILPPDDGTVTLDGRPLRALSRREVARAIAVVPQETHPAFDFTVIEMVLMGRHPHVGVVQLEGPADFAIAREALAATGTVHLADRHFMTLSGGEKQRVVIASALAQSPSILLLDEPTASLDLGYQLEVAALLRRLNRERGATIVLATHDLNLAAALCDGIVLLRDGRVLAQGPTRDVLTAAMVHQVYGVEADVRVHPRAGHLTIVPLGSSGATPDSTVARADATTSPRTGHTP